MKRRYKTKVVRLVAWWLAKVVRLRGMVTRAKVVRLRGGQKQLKNKGRAGGTVRLRGGTNKDRAVGMAARSNAPCPARLAAGP